MKCKTLLVVIVMILIVIFMFQRVGAVSIYPGQGLSFYQVDFTYPNAELMDSHIGIAAVRIDSITSYAQIYQGFLNVITPQGWVVQNMPIDTAMGYPGISAMFDLGSTGDKTNLSVYAELTSTAVTNFTGSPISTFPVGSKKHNAQGIGRMRPGYPTLPIDLTYVNFASNGVLEVHWQPGHPNIEQDLNQCAPAASANSLQWLEEDGGLVVPHEHRSGIRDNSLVGEIDKTMERNPHSLPASWTIWLEGTLKYIDSNDLEGFLTIRHKTLTGFLPKNNVIVGNATSEYNNDPLISLVEWAIDQVKNDKNVEMGLLWDGGGGHAVDLVGGGHILGQPWVAWVHDGLQGFDDKGRVADNGGIDYHDHGVAFSRGILRQMEQE